jgi:hypothetical protein
MCTPPSLSDIPYVHRVVSSTLRPYKTYPPPCTSTPHMIAVCVLQGGVRVYRASTAPLSAPVQPAHTPTHSPCKVRHTTTEVYLTGRGG